MTKNMIKTTLLVLLSLVACGKETETVPSGPSKPSSSIESVQMVRVDPLLKIFKEQTSYASYEASEELARGENASYQFVLKSDIALKNVNIIAGHLTCGDGDAIAPTLTAHEKYVTAGLHLDPPASDALFPASDQYPDCLDESVVFDVKAGEAVPLWVGYRIPKDIAAGDYSGEVRISARTEDGAEVTASCPVSAKVYDVTLPEQTLLVSNWHAYKTIPLICQGESVPLFSDKFYDALTEMVHVMRDHGQNVYWLNPLGDYIVATRKDGKYSFDFTRFDRTVEIYIKEGGAKRIEGAHLAARHGDWESDYWVHVPDKGGVFPLDNAYAQEYLSALIPALKSHLIEKGWWDMYLQHIGDEPAGVSVTSYVDIANYVKALAPDIKILDAVHSAALANTVDVWCPELDHFKNDYGFYQERKAAGDELWYYTCMAPRGNFANRFLELPLIKTRILHWLNFKYGATGYLHWGFNQDWYSALKWMATEGYCPGGDTYIVYPGKKKVYSSIRLEAMLDGINDYELLVMLSKKDPEAARGIVSSVVYDFDAYNTDLDNFRSIRRTILQNLSNN